MNLVLTLGQLTGLALLPLLAAAQAPLVSTFSPGSAPLGTTLTLTGANLTNLTSVQLGGVPAPFAVVNATQALVTVPRQAVNQRLQVSSPAGTSLSAATFQVIRPSTSTTLPPAGPLTTDGSTALNAGSFAVLAVTDVDGDGLLDLLVGNQDGTVQRYEQPVANGSVFAPVGFLTTDGSTLLNVDNSAAPAVTDVDGDGLLDLLVGNRDGTVQRFEQPVAGGGVFASVGFLTTDGSTLLNGRGFATPTVTDVDGDGLLDLLVGNAYSTVQHFEQTAANGGAFALVGLLTTDGSTALNAAVRTPPAVTDVDGDGLLDLLVCDDGRIVQRYEQTAAGGGVFAPVGPLTTNGSTALAMGYNAGPAVTDVDGDGLLDLLVGTDDGTVQRYEQLATPLPVTLVQFTATTSGPTAVVLAWATAGEGNSARFEVQRSADGKAFQRIGTVAAAGNSTSARTYNYLDTAAPAGTSYYRLRQVDRDGTAAYSPVRTVARGSAGLTVCPNPAPGGAALLTGALPRQTVQVLDALGRVAATVTADTTGTAALGGLAPGLYLVQVGASRVRLAVE